ncbi:MAG TPA: hypothetical protein VGD68_05230 [Streptosporangiaceae bacterium]
MDFAGAALLTAALVAVTYPLLEGCSLGWPAWCWALLAAGIAGLALLGLLEVRRQHTTSRRCCVPGCSGSRPSPPACSSSSPSRSASRGLS